MWMLSERSFRGRLLANHKEKKLDLIVSSTFFFFLFSAAFPEIIR